MKYESSQHRPERDKNCGKKFSPHILHLAIGVSVAFILLFAGIGMASATTYYVATWGNDTHDGTSLEQSWQHPSYAAKQAVAGDTIYLMDGTWHDEFVNFANSGTAGNPIVMRAYSGATPIFYRTNPKSGDSLGIQAYKKSYITVEGITLKNYWASIYAHRANNIHILHCNVIVDFDYATALNLKPWGIGIDDDTHNSSIEDCLIDGNLWNSVNLIGRCYGGSSDEWNLGVSDHLTVKGCTIRNNTAHGLIDLMGIVTDVEISNNELYNTGSGIYTHQGFPERIHIKSNKIHDCDNGINFDTGTSGSVIENNYIYDISNKCVLIRSWKKYGNTTFRSEDVIIRNNYCRGNTYIAGKNHLFEQNDVYSGDIEYRLDGGTATILNAIGTKYNVYVEGNVLVKYRDGRTFSVDGKSKYTDYTITSGFHTITVFGEPPFGEIAGTVTDAETGSGIKSATITVEEKGKCGETDIDGDYTITYVYAGTYKITASATGYVTKSESKEVRAKKTALLDFVLIPVEVIPPSTLTPTPTPTPTPADSDGDGWTDEQERRAGTNPYNVDTNGDGIGDSKDPNPLVAPTPTPTPTTSIPAFQIIPVVMALLAVAYLLRRRN